MEALQGDERPETEMGRNLQSHHLKNQIMKTLKNVAIAFSLTLATAVTSAHPGAMGGNMRPGTQAGPHAGMQHGNRAGNGAAGMQHAPRGPQAAAQQLMTPEERTATMEKMRAAKTPEERHQIVITLRAEMQKRATEKGITLPEQHGPHLRTGAQTAPDTSGHSD
jgi:hypothetical protein